MLDDHAGRLIESLHAFPGRVGVGDVVVRQFLALNLSVAGDAAGSRIAVAIEHRRLMRVFAVAQVLHFFELKRKAPGERRKLPVAPHPREVIADRGFVRRAVGKRFLGQSEARALAQGAAALPHLREDLRIVGRIGHDRNARIVLGRCAQHAGTPDVDVLDRLGESAIRFRDGLCERIEVDHDKIDRLDTRRLDRSQVRGGIAPGEYAGVQSRVQGFHPSVEHFREAGIVGHLGYGEALLGEKFRRAAGRQDLDLVPGEAARKLGKAALIGYADQRGPDGNHAGRP